MRLADGRTVIYHYLGRGKGAIRLRGEYGSDEFWASYAEAVASKTRPATSTLLTVLRRYQTAEDGLLALAPRTQRDYLGKINLIEQAFGDLPLEALRDAAVRGDLKDWRDGLAKASRRQADYAWSVLARVLSWALDRGLVPANPCQRGGRLYRGSRADKVWTDTDEALFLARAPQHLHLPLLLALWTGQRQGDLLRLPWSSYDGTHIRLRQSKTGRRVDVRVGEPLKAILDATSKRSPLILVNSDGQPWTPDGFRSSWRKACAAAGIVGVTFHDLRGSFVSRAAQMGSSEASIAYVTGLSLRDVRSILDAHYLHRDAALGEATIERLEKRTKLQNELLNVPTGSSSFSSGKGPKSQ
jgi:integrase